MLRNHPDRVKRKSYSTNKPSQEEIDSVKLAEQVTEYENA